MTKVPTYLKVLKYLYDNRYNSVHYTELEPIIYSEDIRKMYNKGRGKRLVIDGMVCRYMGKLSRKDYCSAEYKSNGNYSYFVGYYIRRTGIELLKKNNII